MTEYTEEQLIKAFERCRLTDISDDACTSCPFFKDGEKCNNLDNEILDLINRQKAEIERLHEVINDFEEQSHKELMDFMKLSEKYENAKAKAVTECFKKFEKKIKDLQLTLGQTWEIQCAIKDVKKEMTEGE